MGAQNIALFWLYHPRWAFVTNVVFCLIVVAGLTDLISRRDWSGAVLMGLVLLMFASLLVLMTRWAMRRGWRPYTAQDAREAVYKAQGLIPPS